MAHVVDLDPIGLVAAHLGRDHQRLDENHVTVARVSGLKIGIPPASRSARNPRPSSSLDARASPSS